jgi:hypothetical protein
MNVCVQYAENWHGCMYVYSMQKIGTGVYQNLK